jgi:CHASE2 domain-containing sensor protein
MAARVMDERSTRSNQGRDVEPEVIPPGRPDPARRRGVTRIWIAVGSRDGRIHVGRPGPLGIAIALLLLGLVAAATLALLIGVFLIWIPVVGVVLAALLLRGMIREWWQRR